MTQNTSSEFEKAVSTRRRESVLSDFWFFLRNSKKWWLLPIVVLLVSFGVLLALSGTAAAPFIYTLF